MKNMKEPKKRTLRQNRSLHKWFSEIANEVNNAGIGQNLVLEGLQVDHTAESIKNIFRAVCRAKYGKVSTTELTTVELQDCVEELTRILGNSGITMGFPTVEDTEEYLNSYEPN